MFAPQPEGDAPYPGAPLASRMRPRSFDDYVGQEHIVGAGKILRRVLRDRVKGQS